jgi:membrane-bound lytic murein transglycosylase D
MLRPLRSIALLMLPAIFLSACATTKVSSQNTQDLVQPTAEQPVESLVNEGPGTENDLTDTGDDMKKIPHEVNRLVLQWVDYFQGRGRPHMERYLSRSGKYLPMMKAILREHGLPEDLVYIALIESGFSATAHSSASAVGYWQFIRGTGRRYSLRIDSYIDERRDFVKATHAAAEYFKTLYSMFGSWYLAIASYNVGENRIKNCVKRYHTHDFWEMTQSRRLPQETVNYVPKFLAARMIAKDPAKYGFAEVEYLQPLKYQEIELTHSVDLKKMADEMQIDAAEFQALNPAYKRGIALEKDGKLTLRVPDGTDQTKALQSATIAMVTPGPALQQALAKLATGEEEYTVYKIRRGDTLASIARKFRTSTRLIRKMNGMRAGARIIAGKRLKVPGESMAGLSRRESRAASPRRDLARAERASVNKNARKISARAHTAAGKNRQVHVVRRGDTLVEIAKRYRISLTQLASHNKLTRRTRINIGTRLQIPAER